MPLHLLHSPCYIEHTLCLCSNSAHIDSNRTDTAWFRPDAFSLLFLFVCLVSRPVNSRLCAAEEPPSAVQHCSIPCQHRCLLSQWSPWGACLHDNCKEPQGKRGKQETRRHNLCKFLQKCHQKSTASWKTRFMHLKQDGHFPTSDGKRELCLVSPELLYTVKKTFHNFQTVEAFLQYITKHFLIDISNNSIKIHIYEKMLFL